MPVVHEEKLRVAWIDTDASGRIHYTAALRYFEVAEHGLMRALLGGASGPGPNRPFSLPRVHVEADFKLALRYADEFTCRARVSHLGTSSVTYHFEISNAAGQLAISGRIIAVSTDPEGKKTPLPEELRKGLEAAL